MITITSKPKALEKAVRKQIKKMVKESKNKIPHARQIEFGLVEDSFMRNET